MPYVGDVPTTTEIWDLILAQRESMMRVALARTRNRQDAEDLVQEAILRAAEMKHIRAATVGPLVRTIVINLAADQHRRAATSMKYEARLCADDRVITPIDEAVCDRSEAAWLHGLLMKAGGRDQEVLLHRAAGHSVRSAGQRLGMSYKAVESAFTRARGHARLAWEATLAILLGGLMGVRRVFRAAPGGAITMAALATGLLAGEVMAPPLPGAPRIIAPVTMPARAPQVAWSVGARAHAAAHVSVGSPAASHSPVVRTRAVDTGAIGNRGQVQAGAYIEDDHSDESLPDTLERCIRDGVVVSSTAVDCQEDPSPGPQSLG